ncbi:sensor histidine kinase [Lacihabitans soyangensis]|uniref:histidine kinase n=1 Tax=Lacihabitans soyangensis TaxID=869394 RepID=A0AAE3KST5_9BACT|nr:sensor histidine kinase [Lacihabitans soyangensis]MCP9762954.1 sensor histidine kinase [Lacihabitans soyangensis]
MKVPFFVFLCLFFRFGYGQTKLTMEDEKKKIAYSLLTEAIAKNDSVKMADGYYEMGKYESGIGNFISGNVWYRKSLPLYKRQKRYFEYGRIYQRIAENEAARKDYLQVKIYSDSAVAIFKKYDLAKGFISNYMFTCDFNYNILRKSPSEVLRNFDEMLVYAKKHDLEVEHTFLHQMRGQILSDSNPVAALKSFELSKICMKKYGFERLYTALNAYMALCYARLEQPAKARELLESNVQLELNSKKDRFLSYRVKRNLAEIEIYKAEKNWEKAFEKQVEYTELQNEIHVSEESKLTSIENSLDISALSKSQERELLLQSQILQDNKKLLIVLIFAGAMFLILGVLLFFQNTKNQSLARKYLHLSQKNELLIKEQSHRVKNNLQLISSLIGLQRNRLKDTKVKDSLEEMQGRIDVMSVLQQLFYESTDSKDIRISDYFGQILNKSEIIFNKPINKILSLENILIEPDLAIHLGIIFNELLTNSFKYAFGFDNPEPSVEVMFQIKNSELHFVYKDNGKNPDLLIFEKDFYTSSRSFGLSLIRLKSTELSGEYGFIYENGLQFTLKCPYHEAKGFDS